MKIVQLYNEQRSEGGGELSVIENTAAVLRARGHHVVMAMRSSRGIESSFRKKARAALSGIYSLSAVSEISAVVERERPDVVHAHGIYPMWSPSIFPALRRHGVPTVLHVHCHYLTCPNWYHLRNSQVCDRCFGGREQWCVITNCRQNIAESAAYAVRSAVARKFRLLTDHVGVFVAVSGFVRDRLVTAGYPADRVRVVRNVVSMGARATGTQPDSSLCIGYCGRLSSEKGVATLIEAARMTGLPVCVAGDGPERKALEKAAPRNVQFLGWIRGKAVSDFYESCRFVVVPSISFEAFSLSAAEAMRHGRPVIASSIGALPEVVIEGMTGLLFAPGNAGELANAMNRLWHDAELCNRYGGAGRRMAEVEFEEDLYYERLMNAYSDASAFVRSAPGARAKAMLPTGAQGAAGRGEWI